MTAIPMPSGIVGTTLVPKRQEYLVNMYAADGYLSRRPGIQDVESSIVGTCRGSATWYVDENAYFVVGTTLYQLGENETLFPIGQIPGAGDVVFSLGQVQLVILVKGSSAYSYDPTNGLLPISDIDYLPSDSVDFIDGRHVFIPSDGSPAFYTNVDQVTIDGFFDAEELPDLNRVCINISNNLYIGGSDSFEIYRTTRDANNPFLRREGARIDSGYVSGIERYKSSFMFIGRDRDQSYAIHLMAQGSTQIMSNEAINELLNSYSKSDLLSVNSFSFVWNKHYFVGWNLPDKTIVFVDGNFIYFDSVLDPEIIGRWTGRSVTFAHGRYYLGDNIGGRIGKIVDSPLEYNQKVEYELKSFIRSQKESYFSISEMVVDCETGVGDSQIGLSLSRNGRAFGDYHYKSLRDIGDYNAIIKWAGGLGVFESLMSFKIRGTGDFKLSIEGVYV